MYSENLDYNILNYLLEVFPKTSHKSLVTYYFIEPVYEKKLDHLFLLKYLKHTKRILKHFTF